MMAYFLSDSLVFALDDGTLHDGLTKPCVSQRGSVDNIWLDGG